jgi:hypothetical protein
LAFFGVESGASAGVHPVEEPPRELQHGDQAREHPEEGLELIAGRRLGAVEPHSPGGARRAPDQSGIRTVYSERVVRPRYEALIALLARALERGELRADADIEQIADLLSGAPFVRLLPIGLPPLTERYAEELLDTIWYGIRPALMRPGAP